MKKAGSIAIIIAIAIIVINFSINIGSGFQEKYNIGISDYSISADGKTLTFSAGVTTSMGYIRGFKEHFDGKNAHYLTFYSTFGGPNSPYGANEEFTLDLSKNATEIYIKSDNNNYSFIFEKDPKTGEWMRS